MSMELGSGVLKSQVMNSMTKHEQESCITEPNNKHHIQRCDGLMQP